MRRSHDDEQETTPVAVRFDDTRFWVEIADGRVLGVPIAWFPRLVAGSPEARLEFELSSRGIHWDGLDEDISVEGMLLGFGDMTRRKVPAA